MTILLETDAVARGLADIAAAAEEIDAAHAMATRRVEAVMTAWRGDAADSFTAAYDAWAAAARDVGACLDELRAGVLATRTGLQDTDHGTAGGVARIADRLG